MRMCTDAKLISLAISFVNLTQIGSNEENTIFLGVFIEKKGPKHSFL